ncbi:aldo/keto reductase [Oscillibacter sp. MSJ-2]|uniref:Aldo/keto reductase n=1 Tax=Dysosmobacter acutus TaxID=2841504 RepID=A0ABS6FCK1_9FIRM|nr:aldo/keto reductase [Dysosmobacter acutus]MBU5627069.1 aldo/keto reductase [Dysosmobacter acutus]
MRYRTLGRTGLQVSEIALGCEGFVQQDDEFAREMFRLAMDSGVNCMDLYSPNPDVQRRVGEAIHGRRDRFILQAHLCTIWQEGQYKATRKIEEVRGAFETMLNNLNTDYVDIGMIHYVDSRQLWQEIAEGPVMRYALEQKAAGRIRCIGVSSHNPDAALAAVESGLIDVLMFSVNPCYDLLPGDENCEALWLEDSYLKQLTNMDPERERLYEACQRLGVGITVMKAFGGGDLLDAKLSPAGAALSPAQCIHYALTRPAVACVMSGARSLEDLRASLAYETASEEEKDYAAAFASFPRIKWEGHCMYCGHCAPCPKGIDVATVTKFLNLARAQGTVPETVREHYGALSHAAGECIRCGACERRCPFGVSAMENMKEASAVFGS